MATLSTTRTYDAEYERRMAEIKATYEREVAEIEAEGNARRDAMLAVKALHVACLNGEMTHEELVVQVEQYMELLPENVRASIVENNTSIRAANEVSSALTAVINRAGTIREAMELLDENKHLIREHEYLQYCNYIKIMFEHPEIPNE